MKTRVFAQKPFADILDVCCGSRMFYDNSSKDRQDTIYMDIRTDVEITYTNKNGTTSVWEVKPDIVGSFTDIPFSDNQFSLVIFDPPHIKRKTSTGIIVSKYGLLTENWEDDLRKGFSECMRVLRPGGFLNFKWSDLEIPLSKITPLYPCQPMYYQRRHGANVSGYWAMFRKDRGSGMKREEAPVYQLSERQTTLDVEGCQ